MSYSNGFHHSPYYQGNAEQDGRNQQSYQNSSRENTTSYQRQTYPSMTSAPTTQPYLSAQASLGATSTSHGGYHTARVETQTHGGPPAINHYPAISRSSIDTTALGNLAYASSLGQDSHSRNQAAPARNNSSMQQIIDYNRSQPTTSFSASSLYGINASSTNEYDPRRSENREPASTRSTDMQNAYGSPYGMYTYAQNRENASSPQAMNRPDSGARMTERASKQTSLTHPPRPASGQNVRLTQSSNQSTPLNRAASNGSHVSEHSHPQPQQMSNVPSKPLPASSPIFRSSHAMTTQGQLSENHRHQTHSPSLSHGFNLDNREQFIQRDTQVPTTIDPNKIFNQVEHLKRQAAVAAEAETARKTAGDAARKKAEAEAQASINENASSSVPSTKDRMELEMKQMIEKMRDYKAKDPNLFSQIWEQVKKGQPANRASSAKESSDLKPSDKTTLVVIENQSSSPSSIQTHLPLESELSIPPLQQNKPDQGKPAVQRRKRKSVKDPATKLAPRRQTSGVVKTKPQTPVIRLSSPAHASSTRPTTPVLASESASVASGAQSMQAAMESYNRNRNSQRQPHTEHNSEIVNESDAGPSVSLLEDTVPLTENHAPGSDPGIETAPVSFTPTKAALTTTRTSTGTIWPQEKQWALATAARNVLTSTTMNVGKNIAAEDIVQLLDQSPSYAELCEILERRGFIIDRGHFARSLLTAVPSFESDNPDAQTSTVNVSKPQSDPPSGSPTLINSDNDIGLHIEPHNNSSHDHSGSNNLSSNGVIHAQDEITSRQDEVGNVNTVTPRSVHEETTKKKGTTPKSSENGEHSFVHFGMLVPSGHDQPVFSSADRPGSSHVQWVAQDTLRTKNNERLNQFRMNRMNQPQENVVPVPLTKKELAKKRSFAELVDLTQEVSDEEDQRMKTKLDMIQNLNDAPLNQSLFMPASGEKRKYKKRHGGSADRSGLSSAGGTEDEGLDLTQFKYAKSQHDLLQSKIIVSPMNKKNDALRRSTYNPKTIARDILVSAGKHSTMAPLNHHLEILRKKFTHVDYSSDLGTFRWDLVDPDGPEAPSTEPLRGSGVRAQKKDDDGMVSMRQHQDTVLAIEVEDLKEGSMDFVQNSHEEAVISSPLIISSLPHKSPRGRPPGSGKRFRNGFRPKPRSHEPTQFSPHFRSISQFSSRPQEADSGSLRSRKKHRSDSKSRPKTESLENQSTTVSARFMPSNTTPLRPSGLRNIVTPSHGIAVVIESPPSSFKVKKPTDAQKAQAVADSERGQRGLSR